jgi:predicted dehydrogenase
MRAAHFVRHRPAGLARDFPEEHPIPMTMLHDLYVLAELVGHEEPVYFDAISAIGPGGTADMAWATLRWADGRVATLHSHWTLPAGSPGDGWDCAEVFGVGYHARIATNPQNFQWDDAAATWPLSLEISSVGGRPTGMLAEELRSFAVACRTGEAHPGCGMADALQVQRWAETLVLSAEC